MKTVVNNQARGLVQPRRTLDAGLPNNPPHVPRGTAKPGQANPGWQMPTGIENTHDQSMPRMTRLILMTGSENAYPKITQMTNTAPMAPSSLIPTTGEDVRLKRTHPRRFGTGHIQRLTDKLMVRAAKIASVSLRRPWARYAPGSWSRLVTRGARLITGIPVAPVRIHAHDGSPFGGDHGGWRKRPTSALSHLGFWPVRDRMMVLGGVFVPAAGFDAVGGERSCKRRAPAKPTLSMDRSGGARRHGGPFLHAVVHGGLARRPDPRHVVGFADQRRG